MPCTVKIHLANNTSPHRSMKSLPIPPFVATLGLLALSGFCPLVAGDLEDGTKVTIQSEVTTARIFGELPDGTPPSPEPAKPAFIVPAKDILETETHEQGGREITIQEIKPIELPPPLMAPTAADPNNPAVQARIAEHRANHPQSELIRLGACVFHPEDSAPRTLVNYWTAAGDAPVTFWSSADFSLLSGLINLVGNDGQTRSLLMMWSAANIGQDIESAPGIPQFPAGKATFIIATGTPTAENLASIQALHDVYNNEHEKLKAAFEGREQARLQQEAELIAHPPQPKDIVLSHWNIGIPAAAPEKGATR